MEIDKSEYLNIFNKNVLLIFSTIEEKYGLKLVKTSEYVFKLPLGKFDVNICLTWGHLPALNIVVSSTDNELMENGIGILNFVEYQESDFHYIDFRFREPNEIPEKLHILSNLLQKYCDQFLNGDFSIWLKVNAFVEDKISHRKEKGKHSIGGAPTYLTK